jgi:hypothetical protein
VNYSERKVYICCVSLMHLGKRRRKLEKDAAAGIIDA